LTSIKERIGVIDAEMKNLPDLMKIEFRLVESRLARVLQDLQDLRSHVDQSFAHVDKRFDATVNR
jgi:hypothetical protein